MTIEYVHSVVIPAAFKLLPATMDSARARAGLLAIGLQESRFDERRQIGGGPARGFWQFENGGGVRGVLKHKSSSSIVTGVLQSMGYIDSKPAEIHEALADNDILACVFARLLLWTSPRPMPSRDEPGVAWTMYAEELWRPGKPHRKTWNDFYQQAWQIVEPRT